jgi:hypothetical protein
MVTTPCLMDSHRSLHSAKLAPPHHNPNGAQSAAYNGPQLGRDDGHLGWQKVRQLGSLQSIYPARLLLGFLVRARLAPTTVRSDRIGERTLEVAEVCLRWYPRRMGPDAGSPAVRQFEDAAGERWDVTWYAQGRKRSEPARYVFRAPATVEQHVLPADTGALRSRLAIMSVGDVRQLLAAAKYEPELRARVVAGVRGGDQVT